MFFVCWMNAANLLHWSNVVLLGRSHWWACLWKKCCKCQLLNPKWLQMHILAGNLQFVPSLVQQVPFTFHAVPSSSHESEVAKEHKWCQWLWFLLGHVRNPFALSEVKCFAFSMRKLDAGLLQRVSSFFHSSVCGKPVKLKVSVSLDHNKGYEITFILSSFGTHKVILPLLLTSQMKETQNVTLLNLKEWESKWWSPQKRTQKNHNTWKSIIESNARNSHWHIWQMMLRSTSWTKPIRGCPLMTSKTISRMSMGHAINLDALETCRCKCSPSPLSFLFLTMLLLQLTAAAFDTQSSTGANR